MATDLAAARDARFALARRIAETLGADPHVVAVALCGSLARGTADHDSDIDLYALRDDPLEGDALETSPLAPLGADRFAFTGVDDEGAAVEQLVCDGIKIDVAHVPLAAQEAVFERALERHEIAADLFKNLAAMAEFVALAGEPIVARLRERARHYPEPLRIMVAERFIRFVPRFYLDSGLARGDRLGFASHVLANAGRAFAVLGALDGAWLHPGGGLKGAEAIARGFDVSPPDFCDAVNDVLERPGADTIERFARGLHDVVDLAHARWPALDAADAHALIDFRPG